MGAWGARLRSPSASLMVEPMSGAALRKESADNEDQTRRPHDQ